jgi:acyl-coenzyme A thioesterase PaaI-like protein
MLQRLVGLCSSWLGPLTLANLILTIFGFFKIRMIGFVSPKVLAFDNEKLIIKVPLNRRTKNHLNSMYFGALATGADLAGGAIALNAIYRQKVNVSFVFASMRAEFFKRAESDAHFVCTDVAKVTDAVRQASETNQRVNVEFSVDVFVPQKLGNEAVARFFLVLSLKQKSK